MGWVYLPTFYHKNQPNVGKYTIHGWYGIGILPLLSIHPGRRFLFWKRYCMIQPDKTMISTTFYVEKKLTRSVKRPNIVEPQLED